MDDRIPDRWDTDDEFEKFMRITHSDIPETSNQWRTMRLTWHSATFHLLLWMSTKLTELPEDKAIAELHRMTMDEIVYAGRFLSGKE